MEAEGTADLAFIDSAVDFIRNYADRCHHGKEEDILFRDLESKPLEDPYKQILRELTQEHVHGRHLTGLLVEAAARYRQGEQEALGDILSAAGELVAFYPKHIEKEDRHFFVPTMECFSKKELADMLERFHEFDRQLIHERYRGTVTQWEAQQPVARKP